MDTNSTNDILKEVMNSDIFNIRKSIRDLINTNRQVGNTTIAIESALKHNAYFIVRNLLEKHKLEKQYPQLHIYTLNEISSGRIRGTNKLVPLVFDPDAVFYICEAEEHNEKINIEEYQSTINTPLTNQVNIKLSDEQLNSVKELNNTLFEGEATLPTVIRLLIKKGLKYFKNFEE